MSIVSTSDGLTPNCFIAIRDEAPQSKRKPISPEFTKMHVWNLPPLPKASPLPRNFTDTFFNYNSFLPVLSRLIWTCFGEHFSENQPPSICKNRPVLSMKPQNCLHTALANLFTDSESFRRCIFPDGPFGSSSMILITLGVLNLPNSSRQWFWSSCSVTLRPGLRVTQAMISSP